jgi:hypothetical protein
MADARKIAHDPTREERQSLWLLMTAPIIWATHFLLCYLTAALWCAKLADGNGGFEVVRMAVGLYTLLALIGIGITGTHGLRRHRFGRARLPHDAATAADRHRFLGFATVLLAGLSAVATLYGALPALFIGSCW